MYSFSCIFSVVANSHACPCGNQEGANSLESWLCMNGFLATCIHGDRNQQVCFCFYSLQNNSFCTATNAFSYNYFQCEATSFCYIFWASCILIWQFVGCFGESALCCDSYGNRLPSKVSKKRKQGGWACALWALRKGIWLIFLSCEILHIWCLLLSCLSYICSSQ